MKYPANFFFEKKNKQNNNNNKKKHKNTISTSQNYFWESQTFLNASTGMHWYLRIPNDTVTGKGKHLSGYTEAQADIDLYWWHMH